MTDLLASFSAFVWGVPLMVLLVGTGLFLTLRFCFIQVRGFRHAFAILSGKYDDIRDPGEITHFRALATALSATVGTGNIVGVAAAILAGGPGAVFWMWVTACVGMATKFTCCTLAVHFRRIDSRGVTHCGPMHYIEMGMGPRFKWLAVLFAVFTVTASFGIGNMFQVNNIVSAVNSLVFGSEIGISWETRLATACVLAVLTGMVILGGIKRIAQVSGWLAPLMCIFYTVAGLGILIMHYEKILPGLALIFHHAFHAPESVAGGLLGGVIRSGVSRGLFSNEAGLGSAPIAHGAARTKEPVREGLIAMLGPFFDTIVICSITALVIVCMGTYEVSSDKGVLTSLAFEKGWAGSGWVVAVSVVLFAFSTLIAWSHYGDRAADYLFGEKLVAVYRYVYLIFIFIGAMRPLDDVINFCDAMNGLMAVPNLIALLFLSPLVADLAADYFRRRR